jgi:hypothetical protein
MTAIESSSHLSPLQQRASIILDGLETPASRWINGIIAVSILLSAVTFVIETFPIDEELRSLLTLGNRSLAAVFAVEYVVRQTALHFQSLFGDRCDRDRSPFTWVLGCAVFAVTALVSRVATGTISRSPLHSPMVGRRRSPDHHSDFIHAFLDCFYLLRVDLSSRTSQKS